MTTAIHKTDTGNIELTMSVPWDDVKKAYESTLLALTQEAEISGFRKGKAPKEKVEEALGKTHVYEEALKQLLPKIYSEAIKEHGIKPIVSPQITLKEAKEDAPWSIVATTCERPEVTVGDYTKAIQGCKADKHKKIWVPGTEEKKETEEDKKPTLDEILASVLTAITITIPSVLIEQEVSRLLSDLIDQTKKLGLTVDQYLSSTGRNSDTIRKEYEDQAKRTITLEFALEDIANKEKIEITDADIDKVIESAKTEEEKKSLSRERYYLASILRRQETLKRLASL